MFDHWLCDQLPESMGFGSQLTDDFMHLYWRDGGLSMPALADRANMGILRTFFHMAFNALARSKDMFRTLIEKEQMELLLGPTSRESRFFQWDTEAVSKDAHGGLAIQACKVVGGYTSP
jgi:hypothetical protein